MNNHQHKIRFGPYRSYNPKKDNDYQYFYFSPCICVMHLPGEVQGAIYIGWLSMIFIIPFPDKSDTYYEFHFLPLVSWSRQINKCFIHLGWLFIKINIEIIDKSGYV